MPPSQATRDLHAAVERDDIDGARAALGAGADPNELVLVEESQVTRTAVFLAAFKGFPRILALLLAAGGDPNKPAKNLFFPSWVAPPTHITLRKLIERRGRGHPDCLRLLLEAGADPNAAETRPGAATLLVAACDLGPQNRGSVLMLLRAGADIPADIGRLVADQAAYSALQTAQIESHIPDFDWSHADALTYTPEARGALCRWLVRLREAGGLASFEDARRGKLHRILGVYLGGRLPDAVVGYIVPFSYAGET
mmetsp:Transcript_22660/g.67995  ORF Transcript_22660/g.67995 Transcript_22660/m.67995 type:complete len:254 (-) Transcript_22660:127-888(-)